MRQFLLAVALCILPSFALAQESVLESPTYSAIKVQEEQEPKAIVEMLKDDQPIGRGTLVAVEGNDGLVITAYHVVFPGEARLLRGDGTTILVPAPKHENAFRVKFRNGVITDKPTFLHGNKSSDWAVVKVTVPNGVAPVLVGVFNPSDSFYTYDLEWKRKALPFRHRVEKGNVVLFDVEAVTGESGGPVFANGQAVGVVSGGWYWLDDQPIRNRLVTWPHRTAIFKPEYLKK